MKWLSSLRPEGEPWTIESLMSRSMSDPRLLVESVETLGLQPVSWVVQLSAEINVTVDEHERDRGYPTSSTGRSKQATERAFLMLLTSIRCGRSSYLSDGLPDELRSIVRADVRHGIPLEVLMNRVWSVHSVAKDTLTERLRCEVTADELEEVLNSIGEAAFDFANVFVRLLATTYEEEQRNWRRRRAGAQRELIERVMAGQEPPESEDAVLPALWNGVHVIGIAWCDDFSYSDDAEQELTGFGSRIAELLAAANVFTYERDGLTYFWWNFDANSPTPRLPELLSIERPESVRLAVGSVGKGVEGFRESFRAAQQTATLRSWGSPYEVVFADDIAHLTMLLADRDAVRSFVRRELGPLRGTDARLAELRETVRLYLTEGNSRVTVAKVLHLAPNTVAYRVGQASELLGYNVSERPTQVLLALQLVDLAPVLIDTANEANFETASRLRR